MDFYLLWDFFFDDYEDHIEHYVQRIREEHVKIQLYYEYIVTAYSLNDFQTHFRVSKNTFEQLVELFGRNLYHNQGPEKISPEKKLAIALWWFGNQEVYRSIGDRFGVAKDTVWNSVFEVAGILTENAHHYIKWPTINQRPHIEEQFRAITGFPGVIGAIDGCHIQISAPIHDANSYINRKGYYSILLQGICDNTLKFIDVFIGMCGSVHDARVWNLSDIKHLTEANDFAYFN